MNITTDVAGEYPDYLRDESRRSGCADSIAFPATTAALREQLAWANAERKAVTVQGGRTGITGGAVPECGHIVNLSRMTRFLGMHRAPVEGEFVLTVQPGVTLAALREAIDERAFDTTGWSDESLRELQRFEAAPTCFFPPDPTETSATVGGMAACNASGARSFFYGPTREYVVGARIVLMDGSSVALSRGRDRAHGCTFEVNTDSGRRIEGVLPSYAMPDVKNAAGYFARGDMDLLDLFVGSEGTLGVLAELDLRLIPRPPVVWGVMVFLPGEDAAVRFVEACRTSTSRPVAVEFFNDGALTLLSNEKASNPAFKDVPDMPEGADTAIYLEYHGRDEESVEEAVMVMSESIAACGGDADATWMASDVRELRRLKDFRHAVPEIVNLIIDERRKAEPRLTKLGTDLAVPDDRLRDVLELYDAGLRKLDLEYVMFGHIGSNHIHVNILPRTLNDYNRAKDVYADWAESVIGMGGTVSAEHGIGKLKPPLLAAMYGTAGIAEMRAVKKAFDPGGLLNPGNLFA